MDHLWTPWRFNYLTKERKPGCPFCNIASDSNDDANFVVHRGRKAFVILNIFPYNSGHLMVLPYAHESTIINLDDETNIEMMFLTKQAISALTKAYQPQGFNTGLNLGSAAGAGIAEHVHQHVVPRWSGDANFMSVIGETRVLPEELSATLLKLRTNF